MMSHIDAWSTLAGMAGLTPPPQGAWVGNDGKPIYFDSIDNSAYILGKSHHSARKSWIYIDGEEYQGARADVAAIPGSHGCASRGSICTAKDSWLGPEMNLGAVGALYNLTMDPYEKYDMIFNGAGSGREMTTSTGRYAGQDNGWAGALLGKVTIDFDESIMKFPSIRRFPGGASTDMLPDLQHPDNPVPLLKNGPVVATPDGD